jgi:hypothetical protein
VFGNRKQKIDPAVKDETPAVVKPAAAAVESH